MSLDNILGNLIKKEQVNNYNFSKSLRENIFPYTNQSLVHQMETGEEVPIAVGKSNWETIESMGSTFLFRVFSLQSTKHLMYFISEVIKKADHINHHPVITIDHLLVEISLNTKDVNDITELDIDLSKYIGELYDDIRFIRSF